MAPVTATFANRVTELLGVDIPIVQAPMGWIARAQLASAVSNAGAMGIIETSSGELDVIREEIRKMRDLTDKPFGVNIAQAFVRDPSIVEFVAEQGVKFVTTSAGSPMKYTAPLKEAGLTVFHVVPEPRRRAEGGGRGRRRADRRGRRGRRLQEPASRRHHGAAPARGVEGGRAGDRRGRVRRRPDDGRRPRPRRRGRAARHAHGLVGRVARSTTTGSRRCSTRRRPTRCSSTSTPAPALRALRTDRTNALEFDTETNAMALFGNAMDLYFGGDMEAAVALSARSPAASTTSSRSPRSSTSAPMTACGSWPIWRSSTRPDGTEDHQ